MDILKTWPIITDAGDSYVFSRKPQLQTHFSPRPNVGDDNFWTQCLVRAETARVGHVLSPAEIAQLVASNEPTYWLTFDLS